MQCEVLSSYAYPKSVADVQMIVRRFDKVTAVGRGHSWSPFACVRPSRKSKRVPILSAALGTGLRQVTIYMERLNRIIGIDPQRMTVTVEAGVICRDLMRYLYEHGFSLKTYANLVDQTIGGLVSTGTHGSAIRAKSLSSSVRRLHVVNADGNVVVVDRDAQPDLMQAFAISVGNLGVLVTVTLDIIRDTPIRTTLQRWTERQLMEFLEKASATDISDPWFDGIEHQTIVWFSTIRSVSTGVVAANPANWTLARPDGTGVAPGDTNPLDRASDLPPALNAAIKALGLPGLTGGVIPAVMKADPAAWEAFAQASIEKSFWCPGDCVTSQGIYHSTPTYITLISTGVKYHQWELAVPLANAARCHAAVMKAMDDPAVDLRRALGDSNLSGFTIRFLGQEDAYLAMSHDGPKMFVGLDDASQDRSPAFHLLTQIYLSPPCNAALHWGKTGWVGQDAAYAAAMFPGFARFVDIRRRLDPDRKFMKTSRVFA